MAPVSYTHLTDNQTYTPDQTEKEPYSVDKKKKLLIGNVELENNLILAPMAGVTDLPFRLLCKEQEAGLLCMEMVSAKAIFYKNKNTENLLRIHPDEPPVSLQLFGSDPVILSEMAKKIEPLPFSILDINMGCPVPKVVNNGEGSALMKNPLLVEQLLTRTVKAIQKPVSYTHLDVYKRQVWGISIRRSICGGKCLIPRLWMWMMS